MLLLLSGIMTALPLLLFADAANRIPLAALGILQYTTPVLQLIVGLLIFHEPLPPAELAGFALVWLAIAIFTVGRAASRRRTRANRYRTMDRLRRRRSHSTGRLLTPPPSRPSHLVG